MAISAGSYSLDECAGTIIQSSGEVLTFCGSYINYYDSFINIDSDGYITEIFIKLIDVLQSGQYSGENLIFDICLPYNIGNNNSGLKGIHQGCNFTIVDGGNNDIVDLANNGWFSEYDTSGTSDAYLQFPQNYTSCGYYDCFSTYIDYINDTSALSGNLELEVYRMSSTSNGTCSGGGITNVYHNNASGFSYEVRFPPTSDYSFSSRGNNGRRDRSVIYGASGTYISLGWLYQLPSIPTGNVFYGWSVGNDVNNIAGTDRNQIYLLASKLSTKGYVWLYPHTKCTVNLCCLGTDKYQVMGFDYGGNTYTVYDKSLTLPNLIDSINFYYGDIGDFPLDNYFEQYYVWNSDGDTIIVNKNNVITSYSNSDDNSNVILNDGDYAFPHWDQLYCQLNFYKDSTLSGRYSFFLNYDFGNKKTVDSIILIPLLDFNSGNLTNQYTGYEPYSCESNFGGVLDNGSFKLSINSFLEYIAANNLDMTDKEIGPTIGKIYFKLKSLLTPKIKVSGSWRTINKIYTKVNGTWKEGKLNIKQGGTWKS